MTTQRSTLYTGPTAEDLDRIPADLKARPQWVLWRGEDRINQQTGEVKLNKNPHRPANPLQRGYDRPRNLGDLRPMHSSPPYSPGRMGTGRPERLSWWRTWVCLYQR